MYLSLGSDFNQPIVLTSNVIHLSANSNNHHIVDGLPNGIRYLSRGPHLKIPLDNVPNRVIDSNMIQHNL